MKKIVFLVFVCVLVIFVSGCVKERTIIIDDKPSNEQTEEPSVTLNFNEKFIVANPVDLDQIRAVSKFRSCSGHEFSRVNLQGEREPVSSMKHYFVPKKEVFDAGEKPAVYAPFNGVIMRIDPDDTARGRQFVVETRPFNGWMFTFFHIDMLPHVKEGLEVKAGDLLGYAITPDENWDFDIALQWFEKPGKQNFKGLDDFWSFTEPMFPHMTDEVLALYTARGVVPENMVISKEFREANPCECDPQIDVYHEWCNFLTSHDDAEHYFPLAD